MNTEAIRQRLELERGNLLGQQAVLSVDFETNQLDDKSVSQHSADDATDLFLRDRDQALRRNAGALILQIDAALDRLDDGTYGVCQRCEQQIGAERLEARPYVAYCIRCQSLMEREA